MSVSMCVRACASNVIVHARMAVCVSVCAMMCTHAFAYSALRARHRICSVGDGPW